MKRLRKHHRLFLVPAALLACLLLGAGCVEMGCSGGLDIKTYQVVVAAIVLGPPIVATAPVWAPGLLVIPDADGLEVTVLGGRDNGGTGYRGGEITLTVDDPDMSLYSSLLILDGEEPRVGLLAGLRKPLVGGYVSPYYGLGSMLGYADGPGRLEAALVPEVGIRLFGKTGLNMNARYFLTTSGRERDFWLLGAGVSYGF